MAELNRLPGVHTTNVDYLALTCRIHYANEAVENFNLDRPVSVPVIGTVKSEGVLLDPNGSDVDVDNARASAALSCPARQDVVNTNSPASSVHESSFPEHRLTGVQTILCSSFRHMQNYVDGDQQSLFSIL